MESEGLGASQRATEYRRPDSTCDMPGDLGVEDFARIFGTSPETFHKKAGA